METEKFEFSLSIFEEIIIITKFYCYVVFQELWIYFPTSIASIYIGHLPNYSELMAGSALARSFTEVTGTAIAWGFSASLQTLIPQAIGDNNHDKNKLIAVYFQRSLLINCIVNIPISFIQLYAGSLMCDINEPQDLCSIATTYCRSLIPFLWFCTISTSLQRVGQCVHLNDYIFYASFSTAILSMPLNYILVFTLNFGYIGTAITVDICYGLSIVILVYALCHKGYSFIFKPLPISIVCTYNGIKEYLFLAIPSLITIVSDWTSAELFILLSGYITNPDIAVSSSSIIYGLDLILINISYAMKVVIAVRVGKYIGARSWEYAKMSFLCGLGVVLCITVIVASIVWIFHDKIPLLWGTHNIDIVYYASILMYVEGGKMIIWSICNAIWGLLLGLGLQKYSAYCTFIAFILQLILLYIGLHAMEWRYHTLYGLLVIWCSPLICRALLSMGLIFILIWMVDMNAVIDKSMIRIKDTIKDYGSFSYDKKKEESITFV